jgi:hypothetical protein
MPARWQIQSPSRPLQICRQYLQGPPRSHSSNQLAQGLRLLLPEFPRRRTRGCTAETRENSDESTELRSLRVTGGRSRLRVKVERADTIETTHSFLRIMYRCKGAYLVRRSEASGTTVGNNEESTTTFRANYDAKVGGGEICCAKQNARVGIKSDTSIKDTRENLKGLDAIVSSPQVLLHV